MRVCILFWIAAISQPALALAKDPPRPWRTVAADQVAQARLAVVQLDGGSGVCISPDGWIVTAAHMLPGWPFETPQKPKRWLLGPGTQQPGRGPPAVVTVRFPDRSVQARVLAIRDRDERSDVAILKADGSGFPYRPVATHAPSVGDRAFAAGWPNGNWAWYECRVDFIGVMPLTRGDTKEREVLDVIRTNHLSGPGASGGGLFNEKLEVIGVCSRGPSTTNSQQTLFAKWEHLSGCLFQAGYSPLSSALSLPGAPTLQVWTQRGCIPCERFKQDLAQGFDCNGMPLQEAFHVELYDMDQSAALAQRLGVRAVPSFLLDDGMVIEGYEGPQWLAQKLARHQFPIVAGVPPPTEPGPAGPPVPPSAAAADEGPGDLSLVEVIVLVEQRDLGGGLFGLVKSAGLSRTEAYLEKHAPVWAADKLGDKLRLSIVFQRRQPERYAELIDAAAVPPSKVSAILLVKEQFSGVLGNLAEWIETKLKHSGIESFATAGKLTVVFERTQREMFAAVHDAAKVDETDLSDEATAGGTGGLFGLLTGWLALRRRQKGGAS